LLAAAMAVSGAAASVVPVQAAMPQAAPAASGPAPIIQVQNNAQSQWWYNQRGGRGWDRGGRDGRHGWRGDRGWDDDDWRWRDRRRGRRDRHFDDDHGAALALGLFGFATGAIVGSQLRGGYGGYGGASCGAYDAHDAACDRRFRSYDWCSNTFLGYDGDRHYC